MIVSLAFVSCSNDNNINTTTQPDNTTLINPKDVLFSIPTIENTFPNFVEEATDSSLQIFEDDWRQIEFISESYNPIIKQELDSIKNLIQKERYASGFKNIYVRKSIPEPLSIPYAELINRMGIKNVEVYGLMIYNNQGRVENGFSLNCNGVKLYGLKNQNDIVTVLGIVGAESDEDLYNLLPNIKLLLKSNKLLLVHWLHQAVMDENNIEQLISHFENK